MAQLTIEQGKLTSEFLAVIPDAATNYLASINLPKDGPVLFITDKQNLQDNNVTARRALIQTISTRVRNEGHDIQMVEFDPKITSDDMFFQTGAAIRRLSSVFNPPNITVVYIGDQWENRGGMYNAIADWSTNRKPARMAISCLASVGDITLMSQITPDRLKNIGVGIKYFEQFFQAHPKGKLIIKTEKDGITGELTIHFDTSHTHVGHDTGVLDDQHPNAISFQKGKISNAGNVLGAESYFTPYLFKNSEGDLVTKEGIKLTVQGGFFVKAENWESSYASLPPMSRKVIDLLKEGKRVPLSELGLGAFEMAGINELPEGCTPLMQEKLRPHTGAGTPPGDSTEKAEIFQAAKEADDFHHTDFVMPPGTTIEYVSEDESEKVQFYPPTVDIN